MAVDFEFVDCQNGVDASGAEVETEAVTGLGAFGELAGGDESAVHVQALAARTHGGRDVVSLAVV